MPNTANAEWNGDLKGGKGHFSTGLAGGRLHLQVALRG